MAVEAGCEHSLEQVGTVDGAPTSSPLGEPAALETLARPRSDEGMLAGQACMCAVGARFVGDEHLIVDLADGRQIIACLVWFPRLSRATAAERGAWELVDGGLGVLWRGIGERLLIPQLLGFSGEDTLTGAGDAPASGLSSSGESAAGTTSGAGTLLSLVPGAAPPLPSKSPAGSSVPAPAFI